MHCVPSRQLTLPKDNLFRALHPYAINRQNLIYDSEQSVKRRLDGVAAIDGDVTVKDFLQNLGIGNQALAPES